MEKTECITIYGAGRCDINVHYTKLWKEKATFFELVCISAMNYKQ